jgi:GAF domain-containing protein
MDDTRSIVEAVQALSRCRDYPAILTVIRTYARRLVGSDGVTFVLIQDGVCNYIEEDAISPLWKGLRFPADQCVGGWVAANRTPAVIEDIFADARVPHGAYRRTFVKSLAVVPVRSEEPIGTIGAYWAVPHRATEDQLAVLQALADSVSVAWANAGLIADLRAAKDAAEGRAAENARLLAELTDQFDRRVAAEVERDRTGDRLWQAQNMDALGRTAAGLAHDFNNILTTIIGLADLLRLQLTADPDGADMAGEIVTAGERGQKLTSQLLRLARQQPFTPEVVDLNRVVADAAGLVSQVCGPRVRVMWPPARGRCG